MITLGIIGYIILAICIGFSEMKGKTYLLHGYVEKGKPFWSAMGYGFLIAFVLFVAVAIVIGLIVLACALLLFILGGLIWIGTHMP